MAKPPQTDMDVAAHPRVLLNRVRVLLRDLAISGAVGIAVFWLLPCWIRCTSLYIGAFVFFANVICNIVQDWKPKGQISISEKAVVISGCDSGFGHMLAQRLDDLGFQVFAGCLFPEGEGAQNLKKSASSRLHVLKMDVTNDEDVQEAVKYVNGNLSNYKLWAVVCNAGLNDGGELNWTDMNTIKKVMEVNLFGVVRVAKAFLPEIIKSKGRVVAVASAAGRYTYQGMVPYCMSKQGVVSFCDGLRLEVAYRWGIQVSTVEPWMFKTNITQENNVVGYVTKAWNTAPAETKKPYPEGYLQQVVKSTLKFLNYSISDRPEEVVACLEEAVTAKYPKYSYNPGTVFSRVTFWFLRRLPKPIADLAILDAFNVTYDE